MIQHELEIRLESWSKAQPDVAVLCARHWEEIAHNREKIPLQPDWTRYGKLAEAGALHCTTARRDGVLVGYMLYMVVPHIHYSTSLTAFADVLYLTPEERKGTAGLRLLRVAEDGLRRIGVQRVLQNVKFTNDWSAILLRMGYTEFEKIYQKLLG